MDGLNPRTLKMWWGRGWRAERKYSALAGFIRSRGCQWL